MENKVIKTIKSRVSCRSYNDKKVELSFKKKNIKQKLKMLCSLFLLLTGLLQNTTKTLNAANELNINLVLSYNDDEIIEFVKNNNIKIPRRIENSDNLGSIIRNIVSKIYEDPDFYFSYNFYEMNIFANDIKNIICEYDNTITQSYITRTTSSYSLQQNTVEDRNGNWVTSGGWWKSNWETFNCYAFSIDRYENPRYYPDHDPVSDYVKYQPGDFSLTGSFNDVSTCYELAQIVKSDLQTIGNLNVTIYSSIPSINQSESLICVRIGEEDYHFMKYDYATDAWYHKPSKTAILKYNYIPSNDRVWIYEYSRAGYENYDSTITYDSEIYFIKYTPNKININDTSLNYRDAVNAGKDKIYKLTITESKYDLYNFSVSSSYSVNINLYDDEMILINSSSGYNPNFNYLLNNEVYYLQIYSENSTEFVPYILSYERIHDYFGHYCIHCDSYTESHDDTIYIWRNTTHHKHCCYLEPHVISINSTSNNNLYVCLLCGGQAIIGNTSLNILSISKNGSYILPNGIIVLDEKDYEDYFSGKLVFYDSNINLEEK